MGRIGILYYSGVGNTKRIAQHMYNYLKRNGSTDIYSIEELPVDFSFDKYSKLIIGFPTIHTEPALLMMHFVQQLGKMKKKVPAFVYTTCGLYSGNAVKILCEQAIVKNIIPVYTRSYRCPAVDGILLTPTIKRWYTYEKNLPSKIEKDLKCFLKTTEIQDKTPKLKWYSALNYPNKVIGKNKKFRIYLHGKKCVKCGLCAKQCPVGACAKASDGRPLFDTGKCINCYRCIHNCPQLALSLSKRMMPMKTLIKQTKMQ